jgi:hypothetical protein
VFEGFVTACLFAGCPINRSPFSVNATIDGVVLDPSAFSMTFAFFPSMTATHEFVVPKSMPMTSFEYERIFAESPCAIDGSTCCDERIDDDDDAVAA